MNKTTLWNRYILRLLEIIAAPYSIVRKIYPQLITLSIVVYTIALVFVYYQKLDWVSAIYAAVNVITTVGLYAPDINTMPSEEKIFLTILILFTVGLFASMVQSLIGTLVSKNTWIDARARWRGRHMINHIVLIGNSESIVSATKKLQQLDKDYVVLTSSKSIYEELKAENVILGDPKDENNLINAGIKNAASAIIAMDDDSETLLITLKVQKLNPPLKVVTMVKDISMTDIMKTAGADVVIPYEDIMGRMLAFASLSDSFAGIIYSRKEREYSIGIFDVKKVIKLKDLPSKVVPIAILRDGQIDPYFDKDTEVKPGQSLFVLGDPSVFKELEKLLSL
ncbi:potassium channel family protein [Stygiolobus caldivivus]|uniref:Potassium transporter TrkA n=1 Tax=Stygiolobus caldivivus TaxID=2824673 RepID=A0A8D5ZIG9_9CREN|nr:NAD-binding protein [Stygiolobus caldivivus]BCU70604.1 potassium transporter TrkA [Stygiolobus caldivivus]